LRFDIWNPKKTNWENCIRAEKILCYETEPKALKDRAMHERDNLLFWDEFIKFTFGEFYSYLYF
jgi:hypothetical protein